MIKGIIFLFAVFMVGVSAAQEAFIGKVIFVSDGDTLWARPVAGGPPRKLRIDGIDAPELCQSGGANSRDTLASLVLYQRVEVTIQRHDEYARAVARLIFEKKDLGTQMVSSGSAWSYRWKGSRGPYLSEEIFARQARLGLFADDRPELPRNFRKRHGPCRSLMP